MRDKRTRDSKEARSGPRASDGHRRGKVRVSFRARARADLESASRLAAKEIRGLGAYVRRQAQKALVRLTSAPVEVSFTLVSDEEIRSLNAQWRGLDRATDVLSFPQISPEELQDAESSLTDESRQPLGSDGPPLLLGDVVVAPATVFRRADAAEDFRAEMSRVVVHGLLHLMGWDHKRDPQRAAMRRKESELLDSLVPGFSITG